MVTFGATTASSSYCADAMRCGEALIAALVAWCEQREASKLPAPGVGIGVDAGTVTCGVVGNADRLEYATIGNPVNRAAKLQNQTRVEAVFGLASLECRDRAVSQGYVSADPQALLAGRTVPGVEGQVSMVAIGAPRMHRRGTQDRGFSGTA